MCKKAYRLRAIFTIQTLALAVEVECWDQSPEGIPTARQNACGDGFFGWKEGKDVAQNRVRKITDPVHRCVCVYVFFGRNFSSTLFLLRFDLVDPSGSIRRLCWSQSQGLLFWSEVKLLGIGMDGSRKGNFSSWSFCPRFYCSI